MDKRKFTKIRKTAVAALCAVSLTCTGLAAACAPEEEPDKPSVKTQREDVQLLKNGNFEFSDVPENAVHLIKSVKNWSRSGDSSGVMSGIINTSGAAWEKMTAPDLKDKLDYNNDLNSSDPDYQDLHVDYNGMDSGDILYADSYAAGFDTDDKVVDSDDIIAIHGTYKDFMGVEGSAESGYTFNGKTVYPGDDAAVNEFYYDTDFTQPIRYTTIENPETHLGDYAERDGKHYLGDTPVYVDENGDYFLDEKFESPVGNVLMIHNYPNNRKYNGIGQHYSSQQLTLEANTAAEITVWVKTSGLKFDKGFSQLEDENRGAYIEVTQTVGSTAVDSFKIRAINTEKILADKELNIPSDVSNNGWLKYTIYINACDFASTSITINLGLGEEGDNSEKGKVTGYAFFDDVEVKKFIDLGDAKCSYGDNAKTITDEDNGGEKPSYCTLVSEKEDKIFIADREVRKGSAARYSDRFYYLIDLASENVEDAKEKTFIDFGNANLSAKVALTTEESGGKTYASAIQNDAKVTDNVAKDAQPDLVLPAGMKGAGGRPTYNDLIGIYGADHGEFAKSDFANTDNANFRDLSARLNSELSGDRGLNALAKVSKNQNGNMLVMLSAYGASYTATLENNDTATDKLFSIDGNKTADSTNYKIISFWVKTSDMTNGTAATFKLIDAGDEDNFATFTIDTTNRKTNIGEDKDIYSGWSQCFFFLKNDTENVKEFKLEFTIGNQTIADSTLTSYVSGWAAIANMQSLDVKENVYKLVSEGDYSKALTFTDEDEKTGNAFDEANGMTNVKTGVASPSSYDGVNGGSSYVTDKVFGSDYDRPNNKKDSITGLINRNGIESYDNALKILQAFDPGITSVTDMTDSWNKAFGEDCYQPLIIVDSLRTYRDRAKANADNFKQYYVLRDGNYKLVSSLPEDEQVFDEDETYYSEVQLVKNYGYIGETQSISSSSYRNISVRVKVAGDVVAYVYLVDPATREVLKYETPEYTFFYDTEGNVLNAEYDEDWTEAEHRAAIVYTLRDDGLYEDKDGKIFANLYNLTTRFKYAKFEHNTFYKKNGDNYELVNYDDLKDGELYYENAGGTYKLASHYLVVDDQRVYEYDSVTEKYYYFVDGKRDVEVNNFSTEYARYVSGGTAAAPEYSVEITDTKGEWETVNFIIKTGSLAKDYRLELWSGKRGETGITDGESTPVNGAVAFDASLGSDSITQSNYPGVLSRYENAIIDVYKDLILKEKASALTGDVTTIKDYEKVLDELQISEETRKAALGNLADFDARYYSYTFYDSADYIPFNQNTAEEGQTGYDYTVTDYAETLAYFRTYDESNHSYNIFADYSAIDQSIVLNSANTDEEESDNGADTGAGSENGDSPWLLITSIIFAAVMLFALIAVLIRYLWKKYGARRRQKKLQQNNYKQRQRAIRRLRIEENVPEAEDETETPAETPVEETPAETPVEEAPAETPVEEAPAETPVEETPAETPVEETPAETPADDGKND